MNLVVYGTRPEEIKLYPFTKHKGFTFLQVDQSKDLHQGLITPDCKCTETELKETLLSLHPNLVIVQGDTRTAFRTALYAFEAGIKFAHVEAGLRTGDLSDPFPEEGYRRMIDQIATYKFCSTPEAVKNCNGTYVGQTSIDTLFEFMPPVADKGYTLVTLHRAGTDVDRWSKVIETLPNPVIVAHPNRVGQELKKRFACIDPVPYREFVKLLAECSGVATDSGGLQEEAIALGKPVTLLRDVSERGHGETYAPGATKKIVEILQHDGHGLQ